MVAVTKSQDWPAMDAGTPGGVTPTIGGGSDRVFAWVTSDETIDITPYTVDTFTVGTVSFTGFFTLFFDNGSQDHNTFLHYWDEAAVAAMSGVAVSYDDSGAPDHCSKNNHVTFQDVDQTTPIVHNTATNTSTDAQDVDTPGTANDFKCVVWFRDSISRDTTDSDNLTEVFDDQTGAYNWGLADGSTADDPTTITGDGINSDISLNSYVLQELAAAGPPTPLSAAAIIVIP